MKLVVVPGITGSDSEHWQTRWEQSLGPAALRIRPSSWDAPVLADWIDAVGQAVAAAQDEVVLVTHSLGCLAGPAAVAELGLRSVLGAVLVAPPDPNGPNFPQLPSFVGLTQCPLGVPGLVIASQNDPYCDASVAPLLAQAWQVPLLEAGALGHLNAASGLGEWVWGRQVVAAFLAGLGRQLPGLT